MWRGNLLILLVWSTLAYFATGAFNMGWMEYVYWFGAYALVAVAIYVHINWSMGDVYDHEMSMWKMDEDQVLRRLAQAMAARGAKPPLERRGKRVWFLLPPVSIVVHHRWRWTTVFVGPSTVETESTVERLKGFVEQTLG
jgi:hypothetical protein